jgi:hypothetical protein
VRPVILEEGIIVTFFILILNQLMPNKRKSRGKSSKFYCPYCQTRLWRMGHQKYYLVSQNLDDIKKDFNLTRKKASLLAAQQPHPVNLNIWIEDFFCPGHGEKIWLRICKNPDQSLSVTEAGEADWKRTSRTIDPDRPNPSVSDYTYRHSRRNNGKKYYEPS